MAQGEKRERRVVVYFTPSEAARLQAAVGAKYSGGMSLFVYQAAMKRIAEVEAELAAAGKPVQIGGK